MAFCTWPCGLLVGGRAGSHDQLVQVSVVDGVVVGSALAVVQLVHIGVVGGLPGSDPGPRQRRTDRKRTGRSVGHIVDSQGEADGLESGGSVGQGLEGRVITVPGSTDVDLILHLGAGRTAVI